ncbi:MAG: TolC family protein [Chthoniobacteraceae bacterium]
MILRLALAVTLALTVFSHAEEIVLAGRAVTRQITGNLTIEGAIKLALQQNPDILRQLQEIERTRGLVITARAAALPHLALLASYNQESKSFDENRGGSGGSGSGTNILIPLADGQTLDLSSLFSSSSEAFRASPDKTWQVSLEIRQALYAGGAIRAGISAAKFGEDIAYWQLRDVIDRVVATTRGQFYAVLTNRSLIDVAEETVKLQEDQLKDQQNRFEAGTVPRFNVITAEVALANVVPLLIQAKNNYLISQIQLAKTLGLDPGPGGEPTFKCVGAITIVERPFDIIQALELGKARRPSLKVQRLQIKIQAEQIHIAAAGYKPRINATGGYLFRNSRLTEDIESHVDGWFIGFTGRWDIFDGLETHGNLKQARAQFEQSQIIYKDSVLQVELEVQQAFANLRSQRETIRSQQKVVEQAVEALRLANERFSAGAGTQLDVLNARTQLTQARTTELQSRGNYNITVAEFDRTISADTTYIDPFRDPLEKLEQKILGERPVEEARPNTPMRPANPGPAKKKKK